MTILDAIVDLQFRGFYLDFSIIKGELFCAQRQCHFDVAKFEIIELHSFPKLHADQGKTKIYAIASQELQMCGLLVCNVLRRKPNPQPLKPLFNRMLMETHPNESDGELTVRFCY